MICFCFILLIFFMHLNIISFVPQILHLVHWVNRSWLCFIAFAKFVHLIDWTHGIILIWLGPNQLLVWFWFAVLNCCACVINSMYWVDFIIIQNNLFIFKTTKFFAHPKSTQIVFCFWRSISSLFHLSFWKNIFILILRESYRFYCNFVPVPDPV